MTRANGLTPIAFDEVGRSPIGLHWDSNDERYILVTEIGGHEFSGGFVTCSVEENSIEFFGRRALGEIAQSSTLEGGPDAFGRVGEVLEAISNGDHPEEATHV